MEKRKTGERSRGEKKVVEEGYSSRWRKGGGRRMRKRKSDKINADVEREKKKREKE